MPDQDLDDGRHGDGVPALSRRTVAVGAGVAAIGASLAAVGCSAPSYGRADRSSGAGGSSRTAAVPGTVLGPTSEVPVGSGKIYDAQQIVVTQPSAGSYQGFSAVCTHQGCLVNQIADGTIDCPCHGSRYRLDGTVANGPAARPLPSAPVTVTNGRLTVA